MKYLYKIILVSLCPFNNNKYYSNRRSTSLVQLGLGQQPKLALNLNRVRSGRKLQPIICLLKRNKIVGKLACTQTTITACLESNR